MSHRVVLAQGWAEAGHASVALEAERSRFFSNRVPVGEDKDRVCDQFREKGTNGVLHGRDEFEHSVVFMEGRDLAHTTGQIRQKLAVVAGATK